MRYTIEVRSIWEFGQRKDKDGSPHQEDSLFPAHGKADGTKDRVFVLCDGMGGLDAGEVASAAVCEAMGRRLSALQVDETFVCGADDIQAAVDEAYRDLDAAVLEKGVSSKMGTTMTCLVLHDDGALIAHMGDSRVYQIRPGKDEKKTKILHKTRDHSLVSDLVAIGEITAEEARRHPRRNVVTRAMQPGEDNRCRPDIAPVTDLKAGDWFYLCSDGMLEEMDDDAIRYIFSEKTGSIDNKVRLLTQATEHNKDNHTAFLVHIVDVQGEVEHPDEKQAGGIVSRLKRGVEKVFQGLSRAKNDGTEQRDRHNKNSNTLRLEPRCRWNLTDRNVEMNIKRTILAILTITVCGSLFAQSTMVRRHEDGTKTVTTTRSARSAQYPNPIVRRLSDKEIAECRTPAAVAYNFVSAILLKDFDKMRSYMDYSAKKEFTDYNVKQSYGDEGINSLEDLFSSGKLGILSWIPALIGRYELTIAYVQDRWYYEEDGSMYAPFDYEEKDGMLYLKGEDTPRVGINEKAVYVTCSPSSEVNKVGFQEITRYGDDVNVKVSLKNINGKWKVTGFY